MQMQRALPLQLFGLIFTGLLIGLGGYGWHIITQLRLPVSKALPLAASLLPLFNFLGIRYGVGRAYKGGRRDTNWSIWIGVMSFILVIFETVIITLSSTLLPSDTLQCPLEKKWTEMFRAKDADGIRGIQDALKCCGFKTIRHQPFPFADPKLCETVYGRTQSCLGPWRQQEQKAASVFLAIGVVGVVTKFIIFILLRTHSRPLQSFFTHSMISSSSNGRRRFEIEETHHSNSSSEDDEEDTVAAHGERFLPAGPMRVVNGARTEEVRNDEVRGVDESTRLLDGSAHNSGSDGEARLLDNAWTSERTQREVV